MGQLIDDMLMLAKVARTEIRREPFDLSNLAGSVAQELRATNPTRRVEFVIAPDLMAEGDASLTRIALENLLGNAWKFTADHPNPPD
jgi:signal transduction histidine kinase